jgi:hypothetical protein
MNKWQAPVDSDWIGALKYVCFNNECPYYVRGWKWMDEKYGNKSSYRHSINPQNGKTSPLAVAYPEHMIEGIID